ncbi:MAG: DUF1684 domain-containing protein [Chloroflexi bacterium]|nr:DUF1684 domain-containing protein [Chloroflexota bacterium]
MSCVTISATHGSRSRWTAQEALTIYQTPHGFFLPFTDTAEEIYGGGRYLEPEHRRDAGPRASKRTSTWPYNPYLAYGLGWSFSPARQKPLENRLNVAIRAGEKVPEGF